MDVRQLAFLARQPSASLTRRETFWGMPKRGIALILANAMFWQPVWAQADGIAVSGGTKTSQIQAGNGVPILNIAAPNASGLSHNQYQRYNVDAQGVILNNITQQTGSTQLGGIIVGNSNLRGTAASTILNEVVGANATQLRGYTEVAGQSARVIVANPYGISCNGCGFINTPQVTLTTGKPVLDATGRLNRFNVQGGSVSIEGVGLNADNVEQFDIITRSAKINAELHAKKLNIITGRNDVDAHTLDATALGGADSDAPQLAIDSSALGGMYVGAVKLVGTEAGVGVRLAGNMAASAGDIQIDVNGKLTLGQAVATGAVNVQATHAEVTGPVYAGSSLTMATAGDLIARQNITARDVVKLSAGGHLSSAALIEAGVNSDNSRNASGDVALSARNLTNTGTISATRDLQATVTQTLNNQGATLNGQSSTRINAATLDNRQAGRVLSQSGSVDIAAVQLLNAEKGLISSNGNLTVEAQVLDNRVGELSSLSALKATVGQIDNSNGGRLLASGNLELASSSLNNQNKGAISGQRDVQLKLDQMNNTGSGSVYAKNKLDVNVAQHINNDQGVLRSAGALSLTAASLTNNRASVSSAGSMVINTSGAVVSQGGEIRSDADLRLGSASLDNSLSGRIAGKGIVLTTGRFDNQSDGQLNSTGVLQLTAGQVNNSEAGRIASAMALTAVVKSLDQTNDGQVYSKADLSLDLSNGLLSNVGGLITAPGQLVLKNLTTVSNRGGEISSTSGFSLVAKSLDNSDGSLLSNKALVVHIAQLLNNIRGLVSGNGVQMRAFTLDNRNGEISSLSALSGTVGMLDNSNKGRLLASHNLLLDIDTLNNQGGGSVSGQREVQLNLGQLNNAGLGSIYAKDSLKLFVTGAMTNGEGVIRSDGIADLRAASFNNVNASLSSADSLAVTVSGALSNQRGEVLSDAELNLISGNLDNTQSGRIAAKNVTLVTGAFDNQQGGQLSSTGRLTLTAGQVNNSEAGRISAAMALNAIVTGLNQTNDGRLYGNTDISLDLSHGVLSNSAGLITAPGNLLLKNLTVVDNQGGEISSAHGFSLSATTLNNTDGAVLSDGALLVRVDRLLNNLRGLVSGSGVQIHAATLDNRQGAVSSLNTLTAVVDQLDNSDSGQLLANGNLLLTAQTMNNLNKGAVFGQQDVQLTLGQLTNTGSVYAKSNLTLIATGQVDNSQGVLRSDGLLALSAGRLVNNSGSASSAGSMTVTTSDAVINQRGEVLSDADLTFASGSLDNSRLGRIEGRGIALNTGRFDNHSGGQLSSTGTLRLNAGLVNNSEAGRIASAMALTAVVTGLDQSNDGRLYGSGDVSLDLSKGVLNNAGGLITAPGQLLLKNLNGVDNQHGEISSANGFSLFATSLNNTDGSVLSDKLLIVRIDRLLSNIRGLVSGTGIQLQAATLANTNGEISSLNALTATLGQFDNSANGRLLANGNLNLTADSINNQNKGAISSQRDAHLNLGELANTGGSLYARDHLELVVSRHVNNGEGVLLSDGALDLRAASLDNTKGSIRGVSSTVLTTDGAILNQGGEVSSNSLLSLNSGLLDNSQSGRISGKDLLLAVGDFDNRYGGQLTSTGTLKLDAKQVNNGEEGRIVSGLSLIAVMTGLDQTGDGRIYGTGDVSLDLNNGELNNQGGLITAPGQLLLKNLTRVDNQQGEISSAQSFSVIAGVLDNTDGVILSDRGLTVRIDQLLTNIRGLVSATGVDLKASALTNRAGLVSSLGSLTAVVGQLDNSGNGRMLANGNLDLTANSLDNQNQGVISGQGDVQLTLDQLTNADGSLYAKNKLRLNASQQVNNSKGALRSDGALDLGATTLSNTAGRISSAGAMNIVTDGALINQGGVVFTYARLTLASGSLDNSQLGQIAGKGVILTTGEFDNSDGARLTSVGTLQLSAGQVNNSDAGRIASAMALTAVVTGLDQTNDGRLYGNGDVSLNLSGGTLNNQGGLITSPGQLLLSNLREVNNQSGEISSARGFSLHASSLNNTDGALLSDNLLVVRVDQLLNNIRGLISANGLQLRAVTLDNRAGVSSSLSALVANVGLVNNSNNGRILANGVLQLKANDVINQQGGAITGQDEVQLNLDRLTNSGSVYAKNGLTLVASQQVSNLQGAIHSGGTLDLQASSLTNIGGSLTSKGTLSVSTTGTTLNQGGEILSDAGFTLISDSLDNTQSGRIAGKGVVLTTGTFDNQHSGQLTSTGTLQLTAGQLNNSEAGRIASAMALTAVVTGLDQTNGGRLYGSNDVSLDLSNGVLNNRGGLITAPGQLLLKNLSTLHNQDGEISSTHGFTLAARSLNNTDGLLLSDKELTVRIDQIIANARGLISGTGLDLRAVQLNNDSGSISSDAALRLDVVGALSNRGGELTSVGNTALTAMSLSNASGQILADGFLEMVVATAIDNQVGTLGAGQGLDIQSVNMDNRQSGSIVTDGTLSLVLSGALDNRAGGSLQAKGRMELTSKSLDNRAGVIGAQNLLVLRSTSADNRGGTIRSGQGMQLLVGALDNSQIGLAANQKGVIYSNAALELRGTRLDNRNGLLSATGLMKLQSDTVLNDQGRIASQADLNATIDSLTQIGGEFVAQGNLTLVGDTLDNRSGGLVGSTKALTIQVGTIDNRAGEISSQSDIDLVGQNLDNSNNGKVLAGAALGLNVAKVNNQNTGLLFGNSLQLDGAELNNTGGTLASEKDLNVALSGALENQAGLLTSERALSVTANTLENTSGSLSSADSLKVTTVGVLNNQAGSITSDAGLTVVSGSLNNSQSGVLSGKGATRITTGTFNNSEGGQLISRDTLRLTAGKVINQNAGRIASALALTADVTSLDQQAGEMFSNTNLTLDLNNGQLNNQNGLINAPGVLLLKNLNGVANQNGEISSARAFTLSAQTLDNTGGKLLSDQALTLVINNALSNIKGTISAASLDANSATLDNTEGLVSSRGDLELTVGVALTNTKGTVIADRTLKIGAASVDNTLGQIASKQNLLANIGTLKQLNGQMIAQGSLTLTGDALDNRQNGLVGANQALNVNVKNVDNRGGELSSQGSITLIGQQLNNDELGQILAQKDLNLTVGQVTNRNNGLLSGKAALVVRGTSLDNSGGALLGLQGIDIDLSGALNNSQGLISSEAALTLAIGGLINTAGSVSSADKLNIDSVGAISNQGGELVTDGTLTLKSASLDNQQQGSISSSNLLTINTGAFNNSQKGRVSAGERLDLTAAHVTNRDGGSIGSNQALNASVLSLDQQSGQLFSKTSLTLDLNHGELNNKGGLINAPEALLLQNLNSVLNQKGEISSAKAFTLTANALNNDDGKLLSNQQLTLRVAQALSNIKGMIAAAGIDARAGTLDNSGGALSSRTDLDLTVDGLLNNQRQGLINASQVLRINSGRLDNQGGKLLGTTGLTATATTLNNTASGLINSGARMTLSADLLDTGSAGEVSARNDMTLVLKALSLNAGRVVSNAALNIDLQGGDLDNGAGLIVADGPLTIQRFAQLNNQAGEISSNLDMSVTGGRVDNRQGKLISNNLLTLETTNLLNQNGLISGWAGVNLSGGTLDNRGTGTLSSRNGDVDVNLSGALLNGNAGALVSQNALTVSALSIDNSGGILSSGKGQSLTVTGLLNNSQAGLIDSGEGLLIKADILDNTAGDLAAQQQVRLVARTLNNSGGKLSSKGAMTLDLLGSLTNTNGKLVSGGELLLSRSTQINNQGGQLVSQSLMTLNTASSLDNRNNGTVASNGLLQITASGDVLNGANGLIYSKNADANVNAARVSNSGGTLQGQGAVDVQVTGDINNQDGRIIAQNGNLSVRAANLDNRGGVLSSLKNAFTANVTGVLNNASDPANNRTGGVIQAQRLALNALSGFYNANGRVSAASGDALISTSDFNNRNGGLYAKGLIRVTGENFDNTGDVGGQIAAAQVNLDLTGALYNRNGIIESDGAVTVVASALDNQHGRLRALGTQGKTEFRIGSLFDNRNGILETANTDLTLAANSFQNADGQLLHLGSGVFDISLPNVTGAGGNIVTQGGLTLNADNWTNTSTIQAGRLYVNVNQFTQTETGQLLASTLLEGSGSNWTNNGLIASDDDMRLTLGGTYSGSGRVNSLGALTFNAGNLYLPESGRITGGGPSNIGVGGTFSNRGRITSSDALSLSASSLENYGTLGSAQGLTVTASQLRNDRGLMFSGANMQLRTSQLTNNYADIYSLGGLIIARNEGGSYADSIENISGTLESAGDMRLSANSVINRKDVLTVDQQRVESYITHSCSHCSDEWNVWYYVTEIYERNIVNDSPTAFITAGRNLDVAGSSFLNRYSSVSAGQNISISVNDFRNEGVDLETIRYRAHYKNPANREPGSIYLGLIDPGGAVNEFNKYNAKYVPMTRRPNGSYFYQQESFLSTELNPDYDPSRNIPVPEAVTRYGVFTSFQTTSSSGRSVNAVIQSGGNTSIVATNTFNNSVQRVNSPIATSDSKVGSTGIQQATTPFIVHLNNQLPPDLEQQRVDPLALPGFVLPTGQNGLFRLSTQGGSDTAVTAVDATPQSWTLQGATVDRNVREQTVAAATGRALNLAQVAQVTASTGQLTLIERQVADVNIGATTLNLSAPGNSLPVNVQLPGRTGNNGTITQVALPSLQPGASGAVVQTGSATAHGNTITSAGLPSLQPGNTATGVRSDSAAAHSGNGEVVAQTEQPILQPGNNGANVYTGGAAVRSGNGEIISLTGKPTTQPGKNGEQVQTGEAAPHSQIITQVGLPADAPSPSIIVNRPDPARPNSLGSITGPVVAVGAANMPAPVTAAGLAPLTQTVNRVTALPSATAGSKPHKYLIETNPVLTELKQFMSSDYLLAGLGYNPDDSAKRLGDGLYEQRLVQQSVLARTGQAFLTGQASNEAQFKYLMNNAISSKAQLNLNVGVSLTAQQVAALTHDIVWLEEHEVNGERVLVPVLYLAQADNRLGPTGALIAGNDLNLIAGQNLDNVGTLRASNNLSAMAGNNLVNSGLIEAGNRLELLAANDVVNKAGGIIKGRDVSITAINGDVLNERTVSSYAGTNGNWAWSQDFADSAARIEAVNNLSIDIGRDFNAVGSVTTSGGELKIQAGRDINILAAQDSYSIGDGEYHDDSSITQLGSQVTAGRALSMIAGRDVTAIASDIDARRDITMAAGRNLTLASAADEEHSYTKGSSVIQQADHVSQVGSTVEAGGNVALTAGQDLSVIASRITAGKDAYLVASNNLNILAAQDSDYTLYDMKKKGGFGSKKTQRDEVTQITHVGSEITTGGDLLLASGANQHYQVATLNSGRDLTIDSGGAIVFEGVKDLHQESHEKSDSDLSWNSMSGKGNTDETLRQTQMIVKGELAIKAVDGLHIDVKQVNKQTVSEAIDAMVATDPQLAWLKEAEQRGDVDWQLIKETHDAYKYSHSGLGQGAMLAIIIIVTIVTAGTGTAATIGGAASQAAVAAGYAGAATAASAAAIASFSAAVAQAAVSVVNNKGDLGAALKDVTSADAMKGYLISGLAAGFAAGVLDKSFGVKTADLSKATHGFELGTMDGFTKFAGYTAAQGGFNAVANTTINGGSLKDNLAQVAISSAADVLTAGIYNKLGSQLAFSGLTAKVGAHALVGGLIAELAGGDFRVGALAAGANEAFVASVGDKIFAENSRDQLLAMTAQLIGLTVAAAAGGSDKDQAVASWVAMQATKYNSLDHPTAERLLDELKACRANRCSADEQRSLMARFEKISADRSTLLAACPTGECREEIRANTIAMDDPVAQELVAWYRQRVSYDMVGLLTGDPSKIAMPAQGYDPWGATYVTDDQIILALNIQQNTLTPAQQAYLESWNKETSWLDRAAGRVLTVAEKAGMILSLGNAMLTEGWGKASSGNSASGNGVVQGGSGAGAKGVSGSSLTKDELISGLPAGTKITSENVVDIRRLPNGRTVWLEKGTDAAGLQHIYKRHEADFMSKGISRDDIPNVVMNALERGQVVGTNGSANVYRVTYNGIEQNIAVGIGSNGFVVRANPVSSWKPLP